jgi:hypothetical protein
MSISAEPGYKTVTTVSDSLAYKLRGGKQAEISPWKNPLGLGIDICIYVIYV